jgi:hypothetical protein
VARPPRTSTAATTRSDLLDLAEHVGIPHGCGPEHHSLGAGGEGGAGGLGRANASPDLNRDAGGAKRLPQTLIRVAGARPVQIDDVNERRAIIQPLPRSATGESSYTVTASKSPCVRRTTAPSSTSTAGMISSIRNLSPSRLVLSTIAALC